MPMMTPEGGMGLGWAVGAAVAVLAVLALAHFKRPKPADHARVSTDPLTTVRERFARGEIAQDQFDEMVDRLLETEDHPHNPSL